jgi:Cu+-exporting ATPase
VIASDGVSAADVLAKAAAAERFSEHPVARAIVAHATARNQKIAEPSAFANEPGHGVIATVNGEQVLVGNAALLSRHGIEIQTTSGAHTIVYVAAGGKAIGAIAVADAIKPDSAAAVGELQAMGLKTVLLTGDNEMTAAAIARQANIDDIHANVRPAGKAEVITSLQQRNGRVAMVGDGINDAPALAQADLGIAIGSGSDVAKEAGDIVLVGGSLRGVAAAIRLSRATMRVIRQNLFFAFIYNVIAIPLAALGLLNPLIAAAAMALSDVTVIGNALRLRRTKID